jgi:ATP/maltotriose-dependent transcriptional regulator MalT
VERLDGGLAAGSRLTLVSAPAGFGKTTLVSEWVAGCGRPAAWLSLDAGDSDPGRFLAYLVASLQAVAPGIGEGLLAVLQSPQPPPIESTLTALLNLGEPRRVCPEPFRQPALGGRRESPRPALRPDWPGGAPGGRRSASG